MTEKDAQLTETSPVCNVSQLPVEMQAMFEIEKARIEKNRRRFTSY
jgi:hypothetical protein